MTEYLFSPRRYRRALALAAGAVVTVLFMPFVVDGLLHTGVVWIAAGASAVFFLLVFVQLLRYRDRLVKPEESAPGVLSIAQGLIWDAFGIIGLGMVFFLIGRALGWG